MVGALINRDSERKIVQEREVKKELGKNTEYIWRPVPIIHKAVFDRVDATLKPVPPPDFRVATDGYIPIVVAGDLSRHRQGRLAPRRTTPAMPSAGLRPAKPQGLEPGVAAADRLFPDGHSLPVALAAVPLMEN